MLLAMRQAASVSTTSTAAAPCRRHRRRCHSPPPAAPPNSLRFPSCRLTPAQEEAEAAPKQRKPNKKQRASEGGDGGDGGERRKKEGGKLKKKKKRDREEKSGTAALVDFGDEDEDSVGAAPSARAGGGARCRRHAGPQPKRGRALQRWSGALAAPPPCDATRHLGRCVLHPRPNRPCCCRRMTRTGRRGRTSWRAAATRRERRARAKASRRPACRCLTLPSLVHRPLLQTCL